MSKHKKYVPKHRVDPAVASARRAPKRLLTTAALLTGLAATATGVGVTGGVFAGSDQSATTAARGSAAAADGAAALSASAAERAGESAGQLAERELPVTRSDTRGTTVPEKQSALGQSSGKGIAEVADMSGEDPREIAKALLTEFGFGQDQFGCLDSLYTSESQWRVNADNPNSSAYGIPQALPGSKMASAGADWATNPVTQIRWGLGYIQDRYGTPCAAWSFKRSRGWY